MSSALKLDGVTLPGSGYARPLNFTVPVLTQETNLALAALFGGAESLARYNRVDSTKMTATGEVIANAMGCEFTPDTNYYDSGFQPGSGWTGIFVAKMPAGASASNRGKILASNRASAGDSVVIDISGADPVLRVYGQYSGSTLSNSLSMTGSTSGVWNIFAARIKTTGERRVWWGHDGIDVASTETAAATRAPEAANLLIGSARQELTAFNDADFEIAACWLWDSALSDADIASNFTDIRTLFTGFGFNSL